ncbi:calcium-binding protein [Dapis sp. BLCC M229]|uniref:calcium-binding protein n=1 Tax=Dapis sp. BLCC M229 TaxID=3400188 RepID=UPI003CEB9BD8
MAETVFNEQVSGVFVGLGRFALRIIEESNPYTMPNWQVNFGNNENRYDAGNSHYIKHETRQERKELGLNYRNVHVKEYLSYSTINGNDADNNITGAQPQSYTWYHGINNTKSSSRHWNGWFDEEINGGKGNDVISGLNGHDTLRGEEGNDVLHAGEGHDSLDGGIGNDALHGGKGSDSLDGGIGSDLLYTGPLGNGESDILKGGANADTFFLGDARTPQEPEVTTGKGFDWGKLGLSIAGDVSDLLFTAVPFLTPLKKTKEIVPMLFDVAKATSNNVTAPVEKGKNDLETGSATITDFNPTEDVIFIPLPSDGDIYIDKNNTDDNLFKVFHDTNQTDVIATVQLSDDFGTLEGNDSNNTMKSSFFNILESNALILDSSGAKNFKGDTQLAIAAQDIEDLGTNKFLVLGAYSGLDIRGSNNADYFYGTQFGDVIYGYEKRDGVDTSGDDVMYGFGGDDQFFGGSGKDRIYGGDGSDSANYMDSTSGITINLQNGVANDGFGTTDTLNSIENIIGSDHDDSITGDGKPNILISAKGNDTLTGNGGIDTFVLSHGTNTITDFNAADKIQIDIKEYQNHYNFTGLNSTHSATNNTLTISLGSQDVAILENISSSQVADALQKIEFITSDEDYRYSETNGPDILIGDNRSQTLAGHGNNDYIDGGASNDTLLGGHGRDVMLGGDGNDLMRGLGSDDIMIGGPGADTFAFWAGGIDSTDKILDFTASEGDKIWIGKNDYGISSLNDLSFNSNGELLGNNRVIAVLENATGFNINNSVELI